MKMLDLTCPHCGAHLSVDAASKQAKCNYCESVILLDDGSNNSAFQNAEKAGYEFEKGRQKAQAEAAVSNAAYYAQNPQVYQAPPQKKRRTWLWVLGWIFIFPLPLTILLVRNKKMNVVVKIILIVLAWLIYILIGIAASSNSDEEKPKTLPDTDRTAVEDAADPSDAETRKEIAIDKIELQPDSSELVLWDSVQLTSLIFPTDADPRPIMWQSSDASVVSVDDSGLVTAVGTGSAIVTASTENGVKGTSTITVDGSKAQMTLQISKKRIDDVNIGDEWSYKYELNGEKTSSLYAVSAGDVLNCHVTITETDSLPDVGETTVSYAVSEEDLSQGFKIEISVSVVENAGSNAGKAAEYLVTYSFSPKR